MMIIRMLFKAAVVTAGLCGVYSCNNFDEAEAIPKKDPTVNKMSGEKLPEYQINGIPHIKQKPDFCGEACAAMYLNKLGYTHTQDDIFNMSQLSPAKGRGCYSRELKVALKTVGFDIGKDKEIYKWVSTNNLTENVTIEFEKLRKDLEKDIPSIVCMYYSDRPKTTEHFRLIVGYDKAKDEVIYHEPAEKDGAYRRMKRPLFMKLWPLKYKTEAHLAIRFRLKKGRIRKALKTPAFSPADFAQHVQALKEKYAVLRKGKLNIVVEYPFVVISDLPEVTLKRYAKGTIRGSVDSFKRQYFKKDPNRILNAWLMNGAKNYQAVSKIVTGSESDTPYGYFSSRTDSMVMNIKTGGGTLIHEIVHPYMEANFPNVPSWFNEGMGSLYEQSSTRKGEIVGLTNWRLRGLKRLVKADKLPSFKELTDYTDHEFYNEDKGGNYAQSRYLCYYMQQKGVLRSFYHEFYKNRKTDPTGYTTLKKVLKEDDMEDFKERWQKWVMTLTFP